MHEEGEYVDDDGMRKEAWMLPVNVPEQLPVKVHLPLQYCLAVMWATWCCMCHVLKQLPVHVQARLLLRLTAALVVTNAVLHVLCA